MQRKSCLVPVLLKLGLYNSLIYLVSAVVIMKELDHR